MLMEVAIFKSPVRMNQTSCEILRHCRPPELTTSGRRLKALDLEDVLLALVQRSSQME